MLLIDEKSKGAENYFGKEITNMSKEKILFLSFLHISSIFTIDDIRGKYDELLDKLNIKDNSLYFDTVLDSFKNDKIIVDPDASWIQIRFSHHLYSQAVDYILKDIEPTLGARKILFEVLRNPPEGYPHQVCGFMSEKFEKLPEYVVYDVLCNYTKQFRLAEFVERSIYSQSILMVYPQGRSNWPLKYLTQSRLIIIWMRYYHQ